MSQPNLTSVGATQSVKMGGFIPENYTFATLVREVILFSGVAFRWRYCLESLCFYDIVFF